MRGTTIELDGRTWKVQECRNGIALLVAGTTRSGEKERPVIYKSERELNDIRKAR